MASSTFRARCRSGDFAGQSRDNKSDAQDDALKHQASNPGHRVDIIRDQSGN
jgi:hypothetical protein